MRLALALLAATSCAAWAAPDEDLLGKREGYPLCGRTQSFAQANCALSMVSRVDEIYPFRRVAGSESPSPFKRAAAEPPIQYRHGFVGGGIDDFLSRSRTTGLLVLQGDTILVERYQYDRTPQHRMNSYSMAKTVVAMLVGIAVAEGRIRSIDDRADAYVPELRGTPYGETSVRHLLTMSSGMRWVERYDGNDDISKLSRRSLLHESAGGVDTVAPFRERDHPPGKRYHYSSGDTQVLSLVLRAAVGVPLADYLSEKIWRPMGSESHATWLVDAAGHETGYAFLQATLRDWGRFGLLLANDGMAGGRALIPAQWVREATTVNADHLRPGWAERNFGYGYQVRILPGDREQFMLRGQRGQMVFVDRATKLVMVHTAAFEVADPIANPRVVSLWQGVVASLAP